MARYAENTSVSSEASRGEIERTLQRYGATEFAYGWKESAAMVGFTMRGRQIKFVLTMPDPKSREFTHTAARDWPREPAAAHAEWEKACRQRWRALALVVKAKLEAVEAGITTFEDEFLAATMLPNGSTVGEWAASQVAEAYKSNRMPALLPGVQRAPRAGA
jgi:hypothetical protein